MLTQPQKQTIADALAEALHDAARKVAPWGSDYYSIHTESPDHQGKYRISFDFKTARRAEELGTNWILLDPTE